MRALVVGGDLERAARPRRVLLEDQGDLLAVQALLLAVLALGGLELGREIEQVGELFGGVVGERQEVAAAEVDDGVHAPAPTASRTIGQDMQRGPPRPRPSSKPAIVITSMPLCRRSVLVATLRS